MASYTVRVLNSSGSAKSYVLFMPPPQLGPAGGDVTVYTNAWVTFSSILPNGIDTITYNDTTFAYWATTTLPVRPGATMGQSGFAAVSLIQQDSVPFIGLAPAGFGQVTAGGATVGAYRIVAASDFNASNGYVFGFALPGNIPGLPSPVATFLAEPNDSFNIQPTTTRCHVIDGSYTTGAVIDYNSLVAKAGVADFSGRSQTGAVVTQNANGLFSTQYY